jgi:hypothetical protein
MASLSSRAAPLVGPVADHRVGGHHVVQRRKPKAPGSAGLELDAEVLGMTVRRAQHPEQDLRCHQGAQVALGVQRLLHQREQGRQPGSAFVLVLDVRRCARGLAEVFLHQAQQPGAIGRLHPVEALHHQHTLSAKRGDMGLRGGQTVGGEQAKAQPFVVHRGAEVGPPPADQAERHLEDVRGGRRAARLHPLAVPPQEGVFLLGAGQRDAEVVVGVAGGGEGLGRHHVEQMALDGGFVHHHALDAVHAHRQLAFGQELQRPGAIAPMAASRSKAAVEPVLKRSGHATAEGVAVGQQAFKVVGDVGPVKGSLCRLNGSDKEMGRPRGEAIQLAS